MIRAVEKLSISVSPEVASMIKTAAAEAGIPVSAWLADAALRKSVAVEADEAGREAARQLVAEYESEHGPLPVDARRRARQVLRRSAGHPRRLTRPTAITLVRTFCLRAAEPREMRNGSAVPC